MRVYRVATWDSMDEHIGFAHYRNKREAQRHVSEVNRANRDPSEEPRYCHIEAHDIPTDKDGLIRWLDIYASHADNG